MIGEIIIKQRKKHKFSQEDLAEAIGVTRQTISNWELNETSPDLRQAQKLCNNFDISMDELIGKENIVLKKVTKTENNSNIIIKLIKILGITLGTLIFILLCIVCIYFYSNRYYESTIVSTGEGRICYYNGKIGNYVVMKNNSDASLSFDIADSSIINKLNLNNIKNSNPKEVLNKIVTYIKNNGGVCLEEK